MKSKFSKIIYVCILALALTVMMPTRAEAITNLKQKTAKKTGVTITWTKSAGEASYQVEYEKSTKVWISSKTVDKSYGDVEYKNAKTVKSKKLTKPSFSCSGLQAGRVYEMKVRAYDKNGKEIVSAAKIIKAKTLPGKPEIVYASVAEREVEGDTLSSRFFGAITFMLQDSADGYQYKLMNCKGKKIEQKNIASSKMKITDISDVYDGNLHIFEFLDMGHVGFNGIFNGDVPVYKVQIRAYQKYKGKQVYGPWETSYALGQPVAQVKTNSDGTVQFRWTNNPEATGYDLYITDKDIKEPSEIKASKMKEYLVKTMGKDITTTACPKGYFKKGKTYHYLLVAKKKVGKKVYTSSIADSYWLKFTY